MTVDSLVQIVALIIAIYALVPRVRQLELRIKVEATEIIVTGIYFFVVLFLLFYNIFTKVGLVSEWQLEENLGLTPSLTAFPLTLLFIIFLWWRLRSNTLPRKSIYKFQELAEELLQKDEYSELISLLKRYWASLIKIEHNQFLVPKIKNYLENFLIRISPETSIDQLLKELSDDELEALVNASHSFSDKEKINFKTRVKNFWNNFIRSIARWFVKILPDYKSTSELAGELIRVIFSKDEFIDSLSKIRPYFALEILKTDYFPRKKAFFDKYLKSLLSNPSSVLFYEIYRIMDAPGKYTEEIPHSLRLLRFLVNDAYEAEKMAIWSPIGDVVLSYLEDLSIVHEEDIYNFPMNSFGGDDEKVISSPIHLAIHFFDLMVGRAIHQNVKWHMWLYYFPHFVDKILGNYKPSPSVDLTAEWPTRYSYFIYLVIKVHEDWMYEIERLMPNRLHDFVIRNISTHHENENIPKSSLIALGFSLEKILFSDSLSDRFKDYLVDIVFRLYLKLETTQFMEDYAKVLLSIFRSEGVFSTRDLKTKLKESFRRIDRIPFLMEVPDFAEEFK